ncbi:MAG TPA: c-type cytochrome [Gemmatimonadaceae bacterium]
MSSTIKKTLTRWTLRIVGGLALTIGFVLGAVYAISEYKMRRHFDVPQHTLVVREDSVSIARGAHLVQIRACVACHGQGLKGNVELDNLLLGRLAGPNLTRGGRGAELTDADWERAVRHGVRRDGRALFVMPATEHTGLSDEDVGAIAAYARSLAPVTTQPPASRAGPIIRAMYLAGIAKILSAEEIDHTAPHPATVVAEVTPQYGKYVASLCTGCHGPNLSGGKIPGGPPEWKPAANITPAGIGHYKEEDFIRALRLGRRPDGSAIDEQMPWKLFSQMSDTELRALYAYLRSVESRAYGSR